MPAQGALVHYVDADGAQWPAFVVAASTTGVGGVINACDLYVLHRQGTYFTRGTPYWLTPQTPETWHYPEDTA